MYLQVHQRLFKYTLFIDGSCILQCQCVGKTLMIVMPLHPSITTCRGSGLFLPPQYSSAHTECMNIYPHAGSHTLMHVYVLCNVQFFSTIHTKHIRQNIITPSNNDGTHPHAFECKDCASELVRGTCIVCD